MGEVELQDLLERTDDPLAEAMLVDGEPNVQRLWSLVPPLVGPTFLGGREISPKVLVGADAAVEALGVGPLTIAPGDLSCYGDAVPACVEAVGANAAGEHTHRLLLAASDQDGPAVWWMEEGSRTVFQRSRGGRWEGIAPEAFAEAMTTVITREAEEVEVAAELHVPELFRSCARLSLLRALNAFEGRHPKYGWGGYEGPEHDAFPPTIIALGHALIDVSLLARAEELVGHWLTAFVTAEGAFDYYGPALSEYGMMLDLGARLARATRSREWFAELGPVLRRIGDRLLRLREERGGLLPGLPEADYHQDPTASQTIYYGNNLWCARGLLALSEVTAEPRFEAAARAWYHDSQMLLRADTVAVDYGVFLPWAAGEQTAAATLTTDREASYANYRFYPEMLSSRLLGAEQAQVIFELRRRRGGEFAGCTRFSGWLDNWPAAEVGLAMLEYGEFAAAQRLLVGHIALCHAVGHQTAYEQVSILPGNSG
ncbi:MAG: hypothetical protein HUU35_04810, partial [Armatimonadetes bacterium]|nr:hypothetical protein [Armatimonadota bacterium]